MTSLFQKFIKHFLFQLKQLPGYKTEAELESFRNQFERDLVQTRAIEQKISQKRNDPRYISEQVSVSYFFQKYFNTVVAP
jgi:hypothetical protein